MSAHAARLRTLAYVVDEIEAKGAVVTDVDPADAVSPTIYLRNPLHDVDNCASIVDAEGWTRRSFRHPSGVNVVWFEAPTARRAAA